MGGEEQRILRAAVKLPLIGRLKREWSAWLTIVAVCVSPMSVAIWSSISGPPTLKHGETLPTSLRFLYHRSRSRLFPPFLSESRLRFLDVLMTNVAIFTTAAENE